MSELREQVYALIMGRLKRGLSYPRLLTSLQVQKKNRPEAA